LVDGLNLSFLLRFSFIFVFLIKVFLKIYCVGAISGCLLEIISAEQPVWRIRRAHQNAIDLGLGVLTVFGIIYLVDFFLFTLFHSSFHIWRSLYSTLSTAVAAYVLAGWMIRKKYIRPLGISHRPFKFNLIFLMVIISACLLELLLVKASNFISIGGFYWRNIAAFSVSYIHVFEFIFCSLSIVGHYPEIIERFNSTPEVFLINPMGGEVVQSLTYWFVRLYPPVFVVLKALTPPTYKFREFNQVVWHERYYKNNVLVCMTCFTSNCYEAYKIAKEFRKRGSKVVMGGPHVTCLPNEALAFCDSVIIGQAEGVWGQVIRDYENGTLKAQYKGEAGELEYSQVYKELLNSPASIVKDFLETMRGCKFRCHFCSVPTLSGGQIHHQRISDFVELIRKIKPHYSQVTFIDNNIYSDPAYSRELFTALKPLKIKWHSQCTIDIAQNQETLKLARESGCVGLLFGYEVSGGSLEKKQGGKFALAQKYIEYTKIVKKAGIKIKGHFIFGFDSDSFKTLLRLWRFCFSIMPQFSVLSLLTPLPGCGLYRDMLTQNRIINLNWRSYGLIRMVIWHPRMNHRVVSFLFPLIRTFFLMTTSSGGLILLVFFLFFPHYG